MEPLQAFVSFNVRKELIRERGEDVKTVEDVCVGAMKVISVTSDLSAQDVLVEIDATYTEHERYKKQHSYRAHERWMLRRRPRLLSKAPEDIAAFRCPACEKPSDIGLDGRCKACGNQPGNGHYQWTVVQRQMPKRRAPRKEDATLRPAPLAEAVGPALHPRLDPEWRNFRARYPAFTIDSFTVELGRAFTTWQEAWASGDSKKIRPFVTDTVYSMHRFWMACFHHAGVVNKLEDVKLERTVLVRVERDAYFEALTFFLDASLRDWIADDAGVVVAGDAAKARRYREYWTLIRRAGADGAAGAPGLAVETCPGCKEPLDATDAGDCAKCGVRLVSGKLAWVVSRIEPEDRYVA